jgi:hypothetical protein
MGRKIGVNLKIDVSKIDKSKLFKGQKGTYLDAQVFIDVDELDQYGNSGMITQAVSKEERDAGNKGAILGNAKKFWGEVEGQAPQQQQQAPKQQAPQGQQMPPMDFDSDIPF